MSKIHKEIKPGRGLGAIKFGMKREEVLELIGEPDHKEITRYSDESESECDSWEYHALRLDLSFEADEDWRLTILSVSSEDYTLDGTSMIGLELDDVLEELDVQKIEDYEIEDAEEGQLLSVDHLSLNFWLTDDVLQEIQWSVLYNDDDTVQWPS